MNEVTRPTRPWGSILSAAATVTALAVFLIFASVASAASDSLTGGTTSLTLKKGFQKKLTSNQVKLLKSGSGTVTSGAVVLGVTGGEIDSAAGQGSIQNGGGFKLKRGKQSASITAVRIDLTGSAVFAKVANKTMKLGSLAPISYTQSGSSVDVSSSSLKLTGTSAKRLNDKLGLENVLKSGDAISDAHSATQVKVAPATPAPPVKIDDGGLPAQNTTVDVMTRNLYLGADLTPAILAGTPEALFNAAGQILKEVEHNDFPTRAKGLAEEILTEEPDLVGMQEVALWRTAPVNPNFLEDGPTATTVKYDYLQELLGELNAGGQRYEVVVVQPEFDFEVPANTGGSAAPDLDGRLTMRDVILKRSNAGVETSNAEGANFATPLPLAILGNPLPVKRGWTATDASVRGSRPFRFVNTHLEAFEPHYRASQAAELIEPPGPATGPLPVVLVGDLNSDDNTVTGADQWAYNILHVAGFVDRSTETPMSCCINDSELGEADGGNIADFDHHIDHVLTNDPDGILPLSSSVTGRTPVNGFWDSDHAGVFSSLEVLP
jgi:endonuclease/exonuclease/phosphatase family metal-dependent hydrolase